jgi:putative hydrolase of the HAD superfamily
MIDYKAAIIKAVVFDLDNTLYEYNDAHFKGLDIALRHISVRFNVALDILYEQYEAVRLNLKIPLKNTAASHNRYIYFLHICRKFNIPISEAEEVHKIYWVEYLINMKLKPGVESLLQNLRKRNIKAYILSNFTVEHTFAKLRALKILQYFTDVITSEEVGAEKPAPSCFEAALRITGIEPNNLLIVGDDYEADILGALRLKIAAVYMGADKSLYGSNLYYSFSSFTELEEFIIKPIFN